MSFGYVPMTEEEYASLFEKQPDATFVLALAEIESLRRNLKDAYSDLSAYKSENKTLREFREKILGVECTGGEDCPDYDGEHPYHLNEMVKAHNEGQEKQYDTIRKQNELIRNLEADLKAALERVSQLQVTCGDLTDKVDRQQNNIDNLNEHLKDAQCLLRDIRPYFSVRADGVSRDFADRIDAIAPPETGESKP